MESNKQELEREACFQLKGKGLSRREIAERLGITERQVKRRLSASANGNLNRTQFGHGIVAAVSSTNFSKSQQTVTPSDFEFEPPLDLGTGEDEGEFSFPLSKDKSLFRHEEGDRRREKVTEYIESKYHGKRVKVLYLADLHIPFTMYSEVMEIVNEHREADIVVINGDLLDLFAVSKFAKDKEVALRRELNEGRELLEFLSNRFKDIIVTEGNHERRLKSFIKNIIPTDMQFLFPDDVLQMVVSGEVLKKSNLDNVHVVGSWWIKLFDTIFAHPDNYTNANLKTVQNTSEFFSVIKNVPHRACIIGHTHRAGKIVSGQVLLMETGCLCHDMDYHNGSKFTKTKWTRAYSVIEIDDEGYIEFNNSDVIFV